MADYDLAGYNILRFDLPLLVEEMLRAGVENFPETLDWSKLSDYELNDQTQQEMTLACAGGACDL